MQENAQFRYEDKYVISLAQHCSMQERLGVLMRPDPHAERGGYRVRSLYLDDAELSCLRDNENGTEPREKCRIRIYNGSDERILLEWKRREHGMIAKQSCPIRREQVERLLAGQRLLWDSTLHPLLRKLYLQQEMRLLRPRVIVEYDRTPLLYPDGRVRVTFDCGVRTDARVAHFFDPYLAARPILPQDTRLLEVKYNGFLPDFLQRTPEDGHLRRSTFSKYYYCMKLGGFHP